MLLVGVINYAFCQNVVFNTFKYFLWPTVRSHITPKRLRQMPPGHLHGMQVGRTLGCLSSLHNPDMIAGGKDVVTAMGDRGVNSSIESQWRTKMDELDKAAKSVPESNRDKTKMNVKLERCP